MPSAQLEPALAELKQLGRADQESQAGEEVTKQYVDLAARLKNSRATEERLLGVLRNNTGKVKDVLEVDNEISRVRGEIEEMEADQRALQARIDFATITLSVTEEYKARLNGAPSSTSTRLHNAFVTGYHSVVENVIGLLAWLLGVRADAAAVGGTSLFPDPLGVEAGATNADIHAESSRRVGIAGHEFTLYILYTPCT